MLEDTNSLLDGAHMFNTQTFINIITLLSLSYMPFKISPQNNKAVTIAPCRNTIHLIAVTISLWWICHQCIISHWKVKQFHTQKELERTGNHIMLLIKYFLLARLLDQGLLYEFRIGPVTCSRFTADIEPVTGSIRIYWISCGSKVCCIG